MLNFCWFPPWKYYEWTSRRDDDEEEEKFALMKYDRLEFNHMTCFLSSLSFVSSPFIFIAKNNKLFHFTRIFLNIYSTCECPFWYFLFLFVPFSLLFPSSLAMLRWTIQFSFITYSKFHILPMPKIGVTDDFHLKRSSSNIQNPRLRHQQTMPDDHHHTIEIENVFFLSFFSLSLVYFFRRNILNKYKKLISRSMLRERNEMV